MLWVRLSEESLPTTSIWGSAEHSDTAQVAFPRTAMPLCSRFPEMMLLDSLDEVKKGFFNLSAALLNPTRQIFLTEQIEESAVVDTIV